jgi:subtilase family serine protease
MNRLTLFLMTAASAAAFARPSPHAKGQDLGRLSTVSSEQVTATVALNLRDAAALQALVASLHNPASPIYRHFLTPAEFQARFAPDSAAVSRVTAALRQQGLFAEVVGGTLLQVSGSASAIERAFGVELHAFRAPDGSTFHAPVTPAILPSSLAADVSAVVGLDTGHRYHPRVHRPPAGLRARAVRPPVAAKPPNTPDAPGEWTVADFAQYYNVKPLYARGINGKGKTIGIVTLAAFTPSDAFAYWASVGLSVDPNRITVVKIDGGGGKPSDASGSDETTLDVEQSGGLAPAAKIVVYVAPNTDKAFLDAWARAVNDNLADAVSTSWGEWEEFLADLGSATNVAQRKAFSNLFIQAAAQGQSLSAAAGDAGSFDDNGEVPAGFTNVLSVDHPAADPFICAAGGTTLAGPQQFVLDDGSIFTVNVARERAWSWDYLNGLCAALGFDPVSCGIFPVGTGGGVSVVFPVPFYQSGLPGLRTSEPKQVLVDTTQTPPQTVLTLPARFAGRNLPDVSFNADPDTGYTVFYTSDQSGFGVFDFFGGTSFGAPQLAGLSVLIDQSARGRVGLLNLKLYDLMFAGNPYAGPSAPFRDITDGNNEFYLAHPAYDQATGVGVMNVANFASQF